MADDSGERSGVERDVVGEHVVGVSVMELDELGEHVVGEHVVGLDELGEHVVGFDELGQPELGELEQRQVAKFFSASCDTAAAWRRCSETGTGATCMPDITRAAKAVSCSVQGAISRVRSGVFGCCTGGQHMCGPVAVRRLTTAFGDRY